MTMKKNEVQYQNDRSDRYVRSISNCADVFGISNSNVDTTIYQV